MTDLRFPPFSAHARFKSQGATHLSERIQQQNTRLVSSSNIQISSQEHGATRSGGRWERPLTVGKTTDYGGKTRTSALFCPHTLRVVID